MENIICGFAGIGKSSCAKLLAGVVDLESTPFNKDWETYSRVAKHIADNGYTVLLSCHKELRQKLLDKNIKFTTVIPESYSKKLVTDSKAVYLKRYRERGNTEQFIDLMSNNWGEFNTILPGEKMRELPLDKYLIDII
jgi:shikimate kinase